jgi:hypothetical protein
MQQVRELPDAGRGFAPRVPRLRYTVVKHEAMAVRRQRQQLVGSEEFDGDAHEARHVAAPEERALSAQEVERSAEALGRLMSRVKIFRRGVS